MDKVIYPVEILLGEQSRVYSLEFQTQAQYAPAWKRVLLMTHGKANLRCCCLGLGNKRLSIHSRKNSDRFHLARFPDTGPEHSEDCVYYGTDPGLSGMGGYQRSVIQALDVSQGARRSFRRTMAAQRFAIEHSPPLAIDRKNMKEPQVKRPQGHIEGVAGGHGGAAGRLGKIARLLHTVSACPNADDSDRQAVGSLRVRRCI